MHKVLIISDFPNVEYQKDSGTPSFRYFIEALKKECEVDIITPPNGKNTPMGSKILSLTYGKYVRDAVGYSNYDLVYGAGCNSVSVAAEMGKSQEIPSIGRLYGTYLYPFLRNPVSLVLRYEEAKAFKAGCTKYIITDDGTRGDKVAEYFGIPKEDLYFWRNGIHDLPTDGIPADPPVIISMARLDKWKRVDRIIKAFLDSEADARLIILGDGPERKKLRAMTDNHMIGFTGQISRESALWYLASSDIFISTNDYSNVSNSLLEAMAMGRCIIALNTGDTGSIITHAETGLLAETQNDLTRYLKWAVTDKTLRETLGNNAKQFAQQNFESWESRIAREVDVCADLIR